MEELALLEADGEWPGGYQLPPTRVTVQWSSESETYEWTGRLDRYDGSGVDSRTRTVPCRVIVDDPTPADETRPRLLTGLYVKIRLHTPPREGLLRVPTTAVQPGPRVWRIRNGKLELVTVQIVRWTSDHAIIEPGDGPDALAAEERIVTSPLPLARHGMNVREIETTIDGTPER